MLMNFLAAMTVTGLINKERKSVKQTTDVSKTMTYIISWCLVGGLFGFLYMTVGILGISNSGLDKIVKTLTVPIHWELSLITLTEGYTLYIVLASAITSVVLFALKWITTAVNKRILLVKGNSPKKDAILTNVYLLNLLLFSWGYLFMPLAIAKTVLFGVALLIGLEWSYN